MGLYLGWSSALKMQAIRPSETTVDTALYPTRWHHSCFFALQFHATELTVVGTARFYVITLYLLPNGSLQFYVCYFTQPLIRTYFVIYNSLSSKRNTALQISCRKLFQSFQSCKALLETPCITNRSHIEPQPSQVKLGVFCYIITVRNTEHVLWINLYKLSKF
jgi:hypothetical protein